MTAQTVARKSLLGGVTFLIIHAVVAAVWRRIILADTYETNGFFDFDEPSALVVLGALAAYFLTGLFMSMLYGHFSATSSEPLSARVFAVLGMLYWVVGAFGFISRHEMDSPTLFLGLEAVMVAGIFTVFALVLPRVFGVARRATAMSPA